MVDQLTEIMAFKAQWAIRLLFLLPGISLCLDVQAESLAPELCYWAHRAAGLVAVDGRLDEPSWQRAPWTTSFQDIEGSTSPVPEFQTRCKMLWDDDFLYVAADLQDRHVWATIKQRDATIYHDNDFEIFIDRRRRHPRVL